MSVTTTWPAASTDTTEVDVDAVLVSTASSRRRIRAGRWFPRDRPRGRESTVPLLLLGPNGGPIWGLRIRATRRAAGLRRSPC